jgi:8-oxo-dGTP pyrophosphatase MutT (NUDIX family)
MTDAGQLQPRVGARVLLLDGDGRVLLIHERIDVGTHWLTPGGGVEAGESLPLAAARELYEETGITVALGAGAESVHVLRREWHWQGAGWDQTDHFFLVRLGEVPEISPGALTAMEQETLIEMRWWTRAELRAVTDELIQPVDLVEVLDRVDRLGQAGPPTARVI